MIDISVGTASYLSLIAPLWLFVLWATAMVISRSVALARAQTEPEDDGGRSDIGALIVVTFIAGGMSAIIGALML